MGQVVKLGGIIAVVIGFSLFGAAKAYSKKTDIKWLKSVAAALDSASELLLAGASSSADILSRSFGKVEGFFAANGVIRIENRALNAELADILNGFLNEFGKGDTEHELRRIKRVAQRLCEFTEEAEADYCATAKIWRTGGVCFGLAAGIMLL
ncbi:MAG: hypothetical protein IKZ47_01330 [Clostridia bacterium]|nr:hypothetical protein [Clostridia bacterium]